ncbi:hypothetical protein NDU88_004488 [Pleurodeles waltl]|uniref:Uncharacterized protein n=1 Tax=Pleurodeles waltl TaxID=8319 RepID=A0AAV7V359_PLEWA|nr:hypothetical protein NDU88_004488 [Pleurodeles waltl]
MPQHCASVGQLEPDSLRSRAEDATALCVRGAARAGSLRSRAEDATALCVRGAARAGLTEEQGRTCHRTVRPWGS